MKKTFGKFVEDNHSRLSFWVCLIIAICLLVGGFFAPPVGVIDNSTLIATSILWAFGALGILPDAIKEGRSIKASYKDAEIEIGSKNDD